MILVSYLDHKMKESGLYNKYTMQALLDKLDILECFEDTNHSLRIGEMLNKQAEIYEALGKHLFSGPKANSPVVSKQKN